MEVVVRTDKLNLSIYIGKGAIVPKAYVVDRLRVTLNDLRADSRLRRVELFGHPVKPIRSASEFDVAHKVLLFAHEFVRVNRELLIEVRPDASQHDVRNEPESECANQQSPAAEVCVCQHENARADRDDGHYQKRRHARVHVGVSGAEHSAIFRKQQVPPVDPVAEAHREHHQRSQN